MYDQSSTQHTHTHTHIYICGMVWWRSFMMTSSIIKWEHFPRYWPLVWGIHRSPVNSPHKGQWRGALMFSFMRARINGWVNNREAGDWRRHHTHYDVSVMLVCFAAIIVQLIYIEQCHFNLPFPIPIQFRIVDDWPNWRNTNLQAKQIWFIIVEMRLKHFSVITSVIAIVVLCVDCACMCFIDVLPDCVLFRKLLNKNMFILFRSIHRC